MTEQRCKTNGCRNFPGLQGGVVGTFCVPCLNANPALVSEPQSPSTALSHERSSTSAFGLRPSAFAQARSEAESAPQPIDEDEDLTIVESLLADYERGTRVPDPVDLNPLPAEATGAHREIARFYKLVRGLRLTRRAGNDDRPAMFAVRFVERHCDIHNRVVSRLLADLVRWNVLDPPIPFPSKTGPRMVHLYAPAALVGSSEVAGQRARQPVREPVDDLLVAGAEAAVTGGPLAAAGDGTSDGSGLAAVVHTGQHTPGGCRP